MIRHIVLVLALTCGSAALLTPPAHACGGYRPPSPEDRVRAAVHTYVRDRMGGARTLQITSIDVAQRSATARISFVHLGARVERTVRLVQEESAWRVRGVAA